VAYFAHDDRAHVDADSTRRERRNEQPTARQFQEKRRRASTPQNDGYLRGSLGLTVPPLLVYHLAGTRLAHSLYGTEDLYTRVILSLWVQNSQHEKSKQCPYHGRNRNQ